jgi:hypothetical protein
MAGVFWRNVLDFSFRPERFSQWNKLKNHARMCLQKKVERSADNFYNPNSAQG